MMRVSNAWRSENQIKDLLDRNEALATEVGRLRGELRQARKKISELLLLKLSAFEIKQSALCVDQDVQTDNVDRIMLTPAQPPNETVSYQVKTPERTPNLDVVSTPPTLKKVKNRSSRKSIVNESPKFDGNILDIADPQFADPDYGLSMYDSAHLEDVAQQLELKHHKFSHNRRSSMHTYGKSAALMKKQSPSQKKVSQALSYKIISEQLIPLPESTRLLDPHESPQVIFSASMKTPVKSTSAAEQVGDDSTRRQSRSTRKPISYQEPSLRVKVRKGFRFFKFQDDHPDK